MCQSTLPSTKPSPQQGPPLNFFIYPYAELDGKPFDGVTRTFHYEDL